MKPIQRVIDDNLRNHETHYTESESCQRTLVLVLGG